jgi:tellurite resistance protein
MTLRRLFRDPAPASPDESSATPPPDAAPSDETVPRPAAAVDPAADTETIRRIAAQLDALPMEQRRFIGGFAYVMGRAAHADLDVSPEEVAFMERTVAEVGGLTEAQAVLVVEIARSQGELQGATEDYLVTRQFAVTASREDREKLLRLAFAVGAVDDTITAEESAEINEIGKELGFSPAEVDTMRMEFADKLSAIQQMRRLQTS